MLKPFKKIRAAHLRVGRRGERLARLYLFEKGLDILTCNYRGKKGEIDIVARDGETLCFVEVKTRRYGTGYRPAAGLSDRQKARIYRASLSYLKELRNPKIVFRYDLIEMVLSRRDVVELRHWPRHFGRETIKKQRTNQSRRNHP